MKMNAIHTMIGLLGFSLALAACRPTQPEVEATPEAQMVLTAAAETAAAQMTLNARPSDTPPPSATNSPEPSSTPSPTSEQTTATPEGGVPAATAPPGVSGGDRAEFAADISVPDGTNFSPGERFTKTWRLLNAGSTTWTTGYTFAFIGGAQMDSPNSVSIPQSVAPGASLDISVNMSAPLESGNYRGFWKMRNASGEFFDTAVYIDINVTAGTPAATGGTPAATATTLPPSAARVTEATLSVDSASANTCPHTFNFTATFTLNGPATVTYVLEAGTDTPGFQFDLPGPLTGNFDAGTHPISYTLTITHPVNGWAQLRVTAPNEVVSNQVTFTLTCP